MNNHDRKMLKWQPFNSVISSKELINDILVEKNKQKKPLLSEEQINNNEKLLITAFYEHEKITIDYYDNGNILTFVNYIKKIDSTYRKIYFYNKTLVFDQIIKVY